MTEPPQQPPYPPPSPFNPPGVNPTGVPARPPGRSGCSKPLLIGCGVVLLLFAGGLMLAILNAPKLVQWSFSKMEQDIMGRLGPDVTPEDRARLATAFENARSAMERNQFDLTKVQAFQDKILELAPAAKPLSQKDVRELTRVLEELAGTKRPPETS